VAGIAEANVSFYGYADGDWKNSRSLKPAASHMVTHVTDKNKVKNISILFYMVD
jgi:hypothetical protein